MSLLACCSITQSGDIYCPNPLTNEYYWWCPKQIKAYFTHQFKYRVNVKSVKLVNIQMFMFMSSSSNWPQIPLCVVFHDSNVYVICDLLFRLDTCYHEWMANLICRLFIKLIKQIQWLDLCVWFIFHDQEVRLNRLFFLWSWLAFLIRFWIWK